MKIVLRADASRRIGSGHVMRCLTLAQALHKEGNDCLFVTREHTGHLASYISDAGHDVLLLPNPRPSEQERKTEKSPPLLYETWLGVDWRVDAAQLEKALGSTKPDWMIIDHYALDFKWQAAIRPYCENIMVIDDLANRQHDCNLLLDQTLNRTAADYINFVPKNSRLLLGSEYAMLRPEFHENRPLAIQKRLNKKTNHVLISFGGGDHSELILFTLEAIRKINLPANTKILLLIGDVASATFDEVNQYENALPLQLKRFETSMAEAMIWSDIAIGSPGATSWERCCMGLPSILCVTDENQHLIGDELARNGAAIVAKCNSSFCDAIRDSLTGLMSDPVQYKKMFESSLKICDGLGTKRVLEAIKS